MPSRLIPYRGCASQLEAKLRRSIQSVLDQSFKDFELIVIADGCESTKSLINNNFIDKRLVLLECHHKGLFDNLPRNTGIKAAQGDYIVYCDIDDYWGEKHLFSIFLHLEDYDFVWYNDFVRNGDHWIERACNIKSKGGSGTSNICHKRSLNILWDRPGYAHDFYFNQKLLTFKNRMKINTPEYFVCHIPGRGGYDV
jgi:glycosyltransferase involved in cell wall biosynthesis